ncbi:MAG TPA: DNA-binding protein [Candidatus Margulisiibacteriota bacterium]|nr:DNA-binding protein [Candidatus Margulisiibacteriota bacterium]
MDESPIAAGTPARGSPADRLDSWKKIASYLKRDVSTVQRWERREAMPVHRHLHDKRGSVFAFRPELDLWWESRRVRLAADGAADGGAKSDPAARPRWRMIAGVAAVAAVIATLGAVAWLGSRVDYFWRSPLADARFIRLTDLRTAQAASISRDGKLVAVLADRDGPIDIWLADVDGGSYRNLTHGALSELNVVNPAIRALSFSADGSFLTVWTRRSDGSQTGDVNVLALPIGGGELRTYLPGSGEFAWSRDGKRLVYHTTAPGDPLFVRDVAPGGGRVDHRIYVAPAGVHCHFPLWSPDDDYIYFVRGVPGDGWDIWRIQPSGSGLERITTQNTRIAYPVMLDRRTILYLATDEAGDGPWLYAVDVERRSPRRISSGLESYTSLAASADGKRLIATITNLHASLWRISVSKDRSVAAQSTLPAIVVGDGVKPRLGGDTTFYIASRAGRQGIWKLTHGDTRELWLSAHGLITSGPAVAPDGRRVAVTVSDAGRTRLYVIDNDTGHADVVTSELVLRGNLAWTPDGQALIAAVVRDGEPRLTRIALNGDSPLPLVSEYSVDPVWSPDGRFLVFSGADVGTSFPLRAVAPDGRPFPLPGLLLARGSRVAFLGDPQTLIILRGQPGHLTFLASDIRSGAQRILIELPANFVARDFDVSASGNEIVFDRIEENPDVALIERGS